MRFPTPSFLLYAAWGVGGGATELKISPVLSWSVHVWLSEASLMLHGSAVTECPLLLVLRSTISNHTDVPLYISLHRNMC